MCTVISTVCESAKTLNQYWFCNSYGYNFEEPIIESEEFYREFQSKCFRCHQSEIQLFVIEIKMIKDNRKNELKYLFRNDEILQIDNVFFFFLNEKFRVPDTKRLTRAMHPK